MGTVPVLWRFLWVGLTAFGAARWTSLEAAFVRSGAISEQDFMRDLAISHTLPGPSFVNLSALCGMRLGGIRMAIAAILLVLLPGLLTIVAALAWLSTSEPWIARLLHGILIGAIGVLAASYVRSARQLRGTFDAMLGVAIILLLAARLPMVAVVLAVGVVGVVRYRTAPGTLP